MNQMQEEQLTLPGTEEVQEDILSDISSDDFLNEMLGDDSESTIEKEVFTEETVQEGTSTEQVTQTKSSANIKTQEQSTDEDHTNLSAAEIFEDNSGNLVKQDGTLIAKNGKERRQYLQQQQDKVTIGNQTNELQRLNSVEQQYRELSTKYEADNQALDRLGLNRDELFQAAQMQQAWKSNPIETINYLLTEARRLGHNIDGLQSGSQLDMNAINRTIEEKLSPITNQYQQQQQMQQQQQETQQKVASFVQSHEYADIHGEHIAGLMNTRNMDASAAYWMLRQQATQAGLDFTKPLAEQAQARLYGQQSQTTQQTHNSVPGVGDLRSTNSSGLQTKSLIPQTPSRSFADIIRESMKESNY